MENEKPVDNVPTRDSSVTSLDNDLIGAPNVATAEEMVVLNGEAPRTSVTDGESDSGSPQELLPYVIESSKIQILTNQNSELSKHPGQDEHSSTHNNATKSADKIDEMEANDPRIWIEDHQTLSSEAHMHAVEKSNDSFSIYNNSTRPSISTTNSGELKSDIILTPSNKLSPLKLKVSEAPPKNIKPGDLSRGLIDTAAPFESVKEAVSKFGGIVDWKAHRLQTVERGKLIDQELEHTQEELPEYSRRCEVAKEEKQQVLEELDSTKRLIEELKLNLEKAETEEHQAKQDSELAKLRVQEMEQGIADEASVAAKAQLEVAKARSTAAASDLENVREELEALHKEYASLVSDKGIARNQAAEAIDACKETERTVEELAIELIATKESLESAHVSRMEAEDKRIGEAMARDQDLLIWEKELKQSEDELRELNDQILSEKHLKSKLDMASTLLMDLKAELAAYMESILKEETGIEGILEDGTLETEKKLHMHVQATIASAKQELEEVKLNTEKATGKVNDLMVAAITLKSELEEEKAALSALAQREGMASVAVASLKAEVYETRTEIAEAQKRGAEAKEKMVQLPKQLQQAVPVADKAKSDAQTTSEELRKVKIEADQVKGGLTTIKSRIFAVKKETEAAKASEKLALAAIKALQESELAIESQPGVTLSLEEYYELSKRAHDAEEQAIARVALSTSQIEVAKESEMKSLEKLEELNREMAARKKELKLAMAKAEKAQEGKLGVEQELRKWRAEHEQRRKSSQEVVSSERTPRTMVEEGKKEASNEAMDSSNAHGYSRAGSFLDTKTGKKKKKRSFFPRVLMFLAKRKAHPNKPT